MGDAPPPMHHDDVTNNFEVNFQRSGQGATAMHPGNTLYAGSSKFLGISEPFNTYTGGNDMTSIIEDHKGWQLGAHPTKRQKRKRTGTNQINGNRYNHQLGILDGRSHSILPKRLSQKQLNRQRQKSTGPSTFGRYHPHQIKHTESNAGLVNIRHISDRLNTLTGGNVHYQGFGDGQIASKRSKRKRKNKAGKKDNEQVHLNLNGHQQMPEHLLHNLLSGLDPSARHSANQTNHIHLHVHHVAASNVGRIQTGGDIKHEVESYGFENYPDASELSKREMSRRDLQENEDGSQRHYDQGIQVHLDDHHRMTQQRLSSSVFEPSVKHIAGEADNLALHHAAESDIEEPQAGGDLYHQVVVSGFGDHQNAPERSKIEMTRMDLQVHGDGYQPQYGQRVQLHLTDDEKMLHQRLPNVGPSARHPGHIHLQIHHTDGSNVNGIQTDGDFHNQADMLGFGDHRKAAKQSKRRRQKKAQRGLVDINGHHQRAQQSLDHIHIQLHQTADSGGMQTGGDFHNQADMPGFGDYRKATKQSKRKRRKQAQREQRVQADLNGQYPVAKHSSTHDPRSGLDPSARHFTDEAQHIHIQIHHGVGPDVEKPQADANLHHQLGTSGLGENETGLSKRKRKKLARMGIQVYGNDNQKRSGQRVQPNHHQLKSQQHHSPPHSIRSKFSDQAAHLVVPRHAAGHDIEGT